jgi:hypothetical protein
MSEAATNLVNRELVEETDSLRSVANTLLAGTGDYDPKKLAPLIDAIRDCAERGEKAGHANSAANLLEIANSLAKRTRSLS